jgi:uncharacterized protein (TIGR00369 family)
MPLAGTLEIQTLVVSPGEVRARLEWSEKLCTSGGVMHGGALMALADTTGGACAFHNLPEGATGTTTIESKTNFLRAVREGYAEAVSQPLHVGRTIIVIDTSVFDAAGRLVSRTTQSQAVLRSS